MNLLSLNYTNDVDQLNMISTSCFTKNISSIKTSTLQKCLYEARKVSSNAYMCKECPFCLFLRFWYLILELFWQCGIFCFSRFCNCSDSVVFFWFSRFCMCSDSVVFFYFLDFVIVQTVWYFVGFLDFVIVHTVWYFLVF